MVGSGVVVKGRVVGFAVWPKLFEVEVKGCVQKSVWNKLVSAVTFRPCILKTAITFSWCVLFLVGTLS